MPAAAHPRVLLSLCIPMLCVLGVTAVRNPQPRSAVEPEPITYRININTADRDTLCLLPGIASGIANHLVNHRELHGPFTEIAELEDVHLIGPKTRAKIEPWVQCHE